MTQLNLLFEAQKQVGLNREVTIQKVARTNSGSEKRLSAEGLQNEIVDKDNKKHSGGNGLGVIVATTPTERSDMDTDDALPIQAEVVMSDGSEAEERNLQHGEREGDTEDSEQKVVNDFLQRFVGGCPSNGALVEYPTPNNEIPQDESDLTNWQLEKVRLPPYTPHVNPPSWLRLTIPADGYCCHSCGDTFFIESSLVQHRERRSVWISLECGPCDAKLTFYNRCALKDHMREHLLRGEEVDEETVVVRSLPLQLTKLLQPIVIPVPESLRPSKNTVPKGKDPPISSKYYYMGGIKEENVTNGFKEEATENDIAKDTLSPTHQASTNRVSPRQRSVRCYLCERMFHSVRELMSHMRTDQAWSDQRVECRKCQLILPSVCAAKSHILTHPPASASNISVCPECGSRCDGPRDFVHHLNTCGHQFRRSGILCLQCKVCFFKQSEDFINHWIKEHCSKSYECVVCSNTFESLVFHKCSSPGQQVLATFKCLLKCPLCPHIVQLHTQEEKETQSKIRSHLTENHSTTINRIHYVYKSKFCTNAFRSKDELRAHHDREHRRENHYRTKTCTLHHEVLGFQHQYFNGQEPRNAFVTLPVTLSAEEIQDAQTRDVPTVSSVIDKTLFPDGPVMLDGSKSVKVDKARVIKSIDPDKEAKEKPPKRDADAIDRLRPCVCYRCGYSFTDAKDFRKHKRSCEGEGVERLCQVCGFSAIGEDFAKHCLGHITQGLILCIYCNATQFPNQSDLEQHFELHVHEQFNYPAVCAFCSFTMHDVTTALTHLTEEHDPSHQTPEHSDFECERCGRKFHGERGLSVHLTRCTVGIAPPTPVPAVGRQCQVCRKALTSEIFGKHIVSHLEEGLLVCSLCDAMTLPSSMALLHHLEEHASTMTYPSVCPMCCCDMKEESSALIHLKEDHGFGNLSCTECEMHYTFTYQLERHIDIVHKICLYAKRRYICWICRAYDHVKKETLMNHFRMVHGLSREEVDEKVMIRTRGQGTMPTSQFIPTKPLGSKELGTAFSTAKTEKFDAEASKYRSVTRSTKTKTNQEKRLKDQDTPEKSNNTEEKQKEESISTKIKIKRELPVNVDNIIIKKEILDNEESEEDQNEPPSKKQKTSKFKIQPKNLFSINKDQKLTNKSKVLIKKLPERVLNVSEKSKSKDKEKGEVPEESKESKKERRKRKKSHRCSECDYATSSKEKFERHLKKHCPSDEEGGEGFVCNECGQSFVVEPSLVRHMFFAHKIKQPVASEEKTANENSLVKEDEMQQNAEEKEKGDSEVGRSKQRKTRRSSVKESLESDKKENFVCSVCKDTFTTSVNLYSHLRTHGMAFLKLGRKKRVFAEDRNSDIPN